MQGRYVINMCTIFFLSMCTIFFYNLANKGSNLPQVVANNPLPDYSNYLPFCHTHYLTPDQYFTSLFGKDPSPNHELEINTSLLQHLTAESSRELRRNAVP